jgi:hypothetical protein
MPKVRGQLAVDNDHSASWMTLDLCAQNHQGTTTVTEPAQNGKEAPWPGSHEMPRWNVNELIDAPEFRFTLKSILAMIGPGLVMGAAAVGGGEWLFGPAVTAKYGAALLWVGTVSILFQVLYNIEISRYTLYTGEPIFTGKFRIMPGPMFWVFIYLLLDWGSFLPYLATNASVAILKLFDSGFDPNGDGAEIKLKLASSAIYFGLAVPLFVGGKVYNSLKFVMSAKLVLVFGFLLTVGICYSKPSHWVEIAGGLVQFGTLPVESGEDLNSNGQLDPGEDFDGDGMLDVSEGRSAYKDPTPAFDPDVDDRNGNREYDEGEPMTGMKDAARVFDPKVDDKDGDGKRDGANVENIFVTLFHEGRMPRVDWSLIALIAGLAAIAGNGGLTNTPISNFTRDQGWGMGHHVGAIPSIVGGHGITLSHEGSVFEVTPESLSRWGRWYRHICRDQLCVWMGACLIGMALPSILSIGFLQRGMEVNRDAIAGMTSAGVANSVQNPAPGTLAALLPVLSGPALADVFRLLTLFCGFLVLVTSMIATMDGFIRRWVDVFWTASRKLRSLDVSAIKYVYFTMLMAYCIGGLIVIWLGIKPGMAATIATTGYNFAFAMSCWHTLVVNTTLLPKELRPCTAIRVGMLLGGVYFTFLFTMQVLSVLKLV